MPQNLEIKARIVDAESAQEIARGLNAEFKGTLRQTDTYFGIPAEGRLKLREIEPDEAELIFYRREESSARRESIFERFPSSRPAVVKKVLSEAFGIRGVVKKSRKLFLYEGKTRIHIDTVTGLGDFLEIEVPEGVDSASEQLDFLVARFGLSDFLVNSYVDLIKKT